MVSCSIMKSRPKMTSKTSKVCDEKRTPRRCILWICLFIFLYATIYYILAQPRFTYINKLKWIGGKYTEHFQSVIPGKSYIFVFSAFKLSSDNNRVSIVSIVDKYSPLHEFKCILRGKGHSTEKWTNATLVEYPESHNRRFSAAVFHCDVEQSEEPDTVSLVADGQQTPANILPIISESHPKRTFTVCVSPLHSRYSKAYQLVEMVEVNLLLGADHFFFYNYSTNWNVDAVLNHYQSHGLATVLQWPLPAVLQDDNQTEPIHYYGQIAMLNDCLKRNHGASRHVIFHDLDELIIPNSHKNWKDLLNSQPANMSAYMFRSSYFHLEWPDVESNSKLVNKIAKRYKANSFLKQYREERVFSPNTRSKYLVDPLQVHSVGIHRVWAFRDRGRQYFVPPNVALVHHYREGILERQNSRLKDNSTLKFIDALNQIEKTWKLLPHIPLGPITKP